MCIRDRFEASKQREKLHAEFGGEERFRRLAPQIGAWGRASTAEEAAGGAGRKPCYFGASPTRRRKPSVTRFTKSGSRLRQ